MATANGREAIAGFPTTIPAGCVVVSGPTELEHAATNVRRATPNRAALVPYQVVRTFSCLPDGASIDRRPSSCDDLSYFRKSTQPNSLGTTIRFVAGVTPIRRGAPPVITLRVRACETRSYACTFPVPVRVVQRVAPSGLRTRSNAAPPVVIGDKLVPEARS